MSQSVPAQICIRLIEAYQARGGGLRFFGVSCNFSPTCSEYTKQAIKHEGLRRGVRAGWRRIQRCTVRDQVGTRDDPYPECKRV